MKGLTLFAFVLVVALSCYSVHGRQLQLQQDQQQPQVTKKLDPTHRPITAGPNAAQHQHIQISPAAHPQPEHRQKRSQRDFGTEYKDWSELLGELQGNSLLQGAVLPPEVDLENMSPLTYFLLLQKVKQLQSNEPVYRVRTPRLGRSIDFQLEDDDGADDDFDARQQQFLARLMKKSVPFKPRLGKRAQVCD